ncbi:MAG: hypothetical protein ACRC7O_17890 [Fimbriiglobus sp.]
MFPLLADVVAEVANDSGKKVATAVIVAAITTPLSFLVGRYWGRYKARREWHAKEFMGRVIVSLNVFADGFLKIRTVMERSLEEVFLNQVAVDKVLAAAEKCTTADPLLPLEPNDRWYILNFVLNAVAEHFVDGQVRLDAGQPVTKVRYALFLTCELVGEERVRKVRAMLVKEEILRNFPETAGIGLENPWHIDRVKTLRRAAEVFAADPDQFLVLEVCV